MRGICGSCGPNGRNNENRMNPLIAEVENVLKNLDTSKAVGPDLIHNKVLKMASPAISNALTLLFNRSLSEGRFPACWKKAHVTLFTKKESKSVCGNYRPISLLSCVGKVLEKCIQKRIFTFLEDKHIINPCQSGSSLVIPLFINYYQFMTIFVNHLTTIYPHKRFFSTFQRPLIGFGTKASYTNYTLLVFKVRFINGLQIT